MSSSAPVDPRREPLPWKDRQDDLRHHQSEWSSGSRGGGRVPGDFGWSTNPKERQEERGSSLVRRR